MVLVDTIYINNGGGRVLLEYLIDKLEQSNLAIVYLIDKRIEQSFRKVKSSNVVIFMEASLGLRKEYYLKNKNRFRKVFCFGNIPPPIKLTAKVSTYFHQPLFIKIPKDVNLLSRLIIFMKTMVLRKNKNHTDVWLVQSDVIKKGIIDKYKISTEVKVLPFFPSIKQNIKVNRKANHFLYVSSSAPHKNQIRLLNAFKMFYDEFQQGALHLTVGNEYKEVTEAISGLIAKGYPVFNYGFIDQTELVKLYMSCEYSVYPSLTESFGLGIIEAIDNGCKLLGADRPYLNSICKPSLKFDPESVSEIYSALKQAYLNKLNESEIVVKDKINDLIEDLK